jgi:2-polyprenyl-3-methyl-5-hydroxy-6-metoxy-1,4-benzoquinol methylase
VTCAPAKPLETIMDQALADHRREAAKASNLTSYPVIKETILRLVRTHKLTGRFLDFGAGRGDLVRILAASGAATTVAGVDMFGRPDDLPAEIAWYSQDLNTPFEPAEPFDVVVCSEVIEHLENPRSVVRNLHRLLVPGGTLILTMPNQESVKAYLSLLLMGHFNFFVGDWYPAHITALLRLDLVRICRETGFGDPAFAFTNEGTIPKLPRVSWQRVSFGVLRGRLFSDNVAAVVRKPLPPA